MFNAESRWVSLASPGAISSPSAVGAVQSNCKKGKENRRTADRNHSANPNNRAAAAAAASENCDISSRGTDRETEKVLSSDSRRNVAPIEGSACLKGSIENSANSIKGFGVVGESGITMKGVKDCAKGSVGVNIGHSSNPQTPTD